MAKQEIRPILVEGQVAYVPLTKGYEAIIDAADVPLVEGANWHALESTKGGTVYATRTILRDGKRQHLLMHRALLGVDDPSVEVDHRDGDGLNNRRSVNLRVGTKSENQCNARLRRDNKTGFKGVFYYRPTDTWRASIRYQGKQLHLGYHRCPTAAALAYARASRELHGEFGRVA